MGLTAPLPSCVPDSLHILSFGVPGSSDRTVLYRRGFGPLLPTDLPNLVSVRGLYLSPCFSRFHLVLDLREINRMQICCFRESDKCGAHTHRKRHLPLPLRAEFGGSRPVLLDICSRQASPRYSVFGQGFPQTG